MGVVFKLNAAGVETVLHTFTGGADGGSPYGGVILDSKGNLYGTTSAGGASGHGVVYRLSAAGKETVLYNFTGAADGDNRSDTCLGTWPVIYTAPRPAAEPADKALFSKWIRRDRKRCCTASPVARMAEVPRVA
jgi:uncharacterized repeat protein (TIGR03803 family)